MLLQACQYLGKICLLLLACRSVNAHSNSETPKLIIISMDGFRWNYLDKFTEAEVPHFTFLKTNGAWAKEGMENTFVTKTMANHVTLVTGLYEESHGIMANSFYDPVFKEAYSAANVTQNVDSKWYDTGAEPIWVTNQKADNIERRSGSVMWPGCGAPQKGYVPSRFILYDDAMDLMTRVNMLVSWFLLNQPINLGLLYINEPDLTGHFHGPDSKELKTMILHLDTVLGYLFKKLKDSDLWEDMNIILTSDHGMATTPKDKRINLDNFVNPELYTMYTSNPVSMVLPVQGKEKEVYDGFKKAKNLNVYWKEEIPEKFHFKNNRRVTPILILAEPHYSLSHNNRTDNTVANHGYRNTFTDMHPIFMAYGPAFNNVTVKSFLNVDVYTIMCYVLDIKPAPNNGSLERVQTLLKLKPKLPSGGTTAAYFVLIPILVLVAGIITVTGFRKRRFLRSRGDFQDYSHTMLDTLVTESGQEDEEKEEILYIDEEEIP